MLFFSFCSFFSIALQGAELLTPTCSVAVFAEGHSAPTVNLLCQGTPLFPEATGDGNQRTGKIIIVRCWSLGLFLVAEDDPGPGKNK